MSGVKAEKPAFYLAPTELPRDAAFGPCLQGLVRVLLLSLGETLLPSDIFVLKKKKWFVQNE